MTNKVIVLNFLIDIFVYLLVFHYIFGIYCLQLFLIASCKMFFLSMEIVLDYLGSTENNKDLLIFFFFALELWTSKIIDTFLIPFDFFEQFLLDILCEIDKVFNSSNRNFLMLKFFCNCTHPFRYAKRVEFLKQFFE